MNRRLTSAACIAFTALVIMRAARADESDAFAPLVREYSQSAQPLIKQYCLECHSTAKHEGELDLERFRALDDLRHGTRTWVKVAEFIDNGEMPPKEAARPLGDSDRRQLRGWIERFLKAEALATAGDPGPVGLRRLNNAEYTYTIRDLTGVASLDPTREFPADGAAGEGFTNAGGALAMSPALMGKYLEAAKEVAAHAVLLPDGIRFSPSTTRRDWTNETLAKIRELYGHYTATQGGDKVNLQGIVFDTNQGGRLPLEAYFAATLAEREALASGSKSVDQVARERRMSPKYLGILWQALIAKDSSLLLDPLRQHWRNAKPADGPALAADVAAWQQGLWRFSTVGHIGKVGGPKAWLEPASPLVPRHELRLKIPPSADGSDVTLTLLASDAGDGNEQDFVVWHQPRLVAPGRPDLPLRDIRQVAAELSAHRSRLFAQTAECLAAAGEIAATAGPGSASEAAKKHGIDERDLAAWLALLGIDGGGPTEVKGHFANKITSAGDYDFIQGWGSHDTPLLLANSSDQHVRIPGNMQPHGVAMHPSPKLRVAIGWQSPVNAAVRIEGRVEHAHPECGNGVTWSLEHRRGTTGRRLAQGVAQGNKQASLGPLDVEIKVGDLVSLVIGPRDGNHACDLTAVDLHLTAAGKPGQDWLLSADVAGNVLAGNPHPDRKGNDKVWHFYTEPVENETETVAAIPPGSLLARWQAASQGQRPTLAEQLEQLLTGDLKAPSVAEEDAAFYRMLRSLGGPLLSRSVRPGESATNEPPASGDSIYGLDPARFGKHPSGQAIDEASLCIRAPAAIELRLPADLVAGCELVTTGSLHSATGTEGSVQLAIVAGSEKPANRLVPSALATTSASGPWTGNNRRIAWAAPVLVSEGSAAARRLEADFHAFRQLFPAALCYTKIVPVDEVVTLTLFYREDEHLVRLMLDGAQRAELDGLWAELRYISQDALTLVDALEQLIEYATQDADPKVFTPLREPFAQRAAAFRRQLVDSEPRHWDALALFASRAYRRPLAPEEEQQLRGLYAQLRRQELSHEEAFRLTLARIFVSPPFLYRLESAPPGEQPGPVSDWELATRLSYFLWSSQPDDELRQVAAAGQLRVPAMLSEQNRRMLRDRRSRSLASEFACQWLQIYDFAAHDEKSERQFPSFKDLRGDMQEEAVLLFADVVQRDGSILSLLDADHTFLNEKLAAHYDIPGVSGRDWRRVEGVRQHDRGGILGLAATLSKQSGASRTSPILRGTWISEVLLGEKLPRPPKDVPLLPDEVPAEGLTVRQLVERHTSDERCAGCHRRIDPFGFALEGYDAIGRRRPQDQAGQPLDTRTRLPDGTDIDGMEGLRQYLLTTRRDAFVRQFCRKLLGYALGRGVQLSDEPLLDEMQRKLAASGYRFSIAAETIIHSPQFLHIRGREAPSEDVAP